MKKTLFALLCIALGAFLWWAFSPLFIDTEVKDTLDPTLQARLEAQRQVDAARKQQPATSSDSTEESPTVHTEVTADGSLSRGPFPIKGTSGHPVSGTVDVVESPEERVLYFQDYDGTNGPDLHVYLSKDLEATDIIDLGTAKGNKGDIVYGMPLDVDLTEYPYVLTWCKAFNVLLKKKKIN
ncbi:DM13 domain-containing protein [Candidatus Kaiserbacteria bacterium]|nr:DM13 domain-containing protein [Candidatus Kaiserbacteria bacterium]